MEGHEGSVWGLLMSSFALISGGLDGMVKLWDPRTRDLIRQLYKHNSSVCSFSVQANVFYSCAVDNIIKVWDWKDGTCLGTMHGHRETVANLCLTPEGTLFSSGIDKMVKVWKPPGSWGEEWHGLRDLDLTTAGMVAEDVDRLEKQLRGEAAKWVSLSVSNNYLYDEGIGKLVKVLRNTTAPLELLDLSKTNMTSVGAKMVAQLLSPPDSPPGSPQKADGTTETQQALPLKKLVLHSNEIDAEGYAAIGAAVRHEKCGLKEIVLSTHTKEAKSGSRKTVTLTEHNSIKIEEVRTSHRMMHDRDATGLSGRCGADGTRRDAPAQHDALSDTAQEERNRRRRRDRAREGDRDGAHADTRGAPLRQSCVCRGRSGGCGGPDAWAVLPR